MEINPTVHTIDTDIHIIYESGWVEESLCVQEIINEMHRWSKPRTPINLCVFSNTVGVVGVSLVHWKAR